MSVHLSVEHRGLDHLGWFNTYLDAKISFLGMICLNNPTTIALKLISTRISYDLKSYCLQARILAAPSGGPTGGSGFSSCCSSSGAAAAVSNLEQGSASSKTAGQGPGASWQQAEDVIDREANLEVDLWGLLSRLGSAQLLAMVLKMLRVIQAPLLLYSAATLLVIVLGWTPLFMAMAAFCAWRLGRAVFLRSERFELRRRLVGLALLSCVLALNLAAGGHLWAGGGDGINNGDGQLRR